MADRRGPSLCLTLRTQLYALGHLLQWPCLLGQQAPQALACGHRHAWCSSGKCCTGGWVCVGIMGDAAQGALPGNATYGAPLCLVVVGDFGGCPGAVPWEAAPNSTGVYTNSMLPERMLKMPSDWLWDECFVKSGNPKMTLPLAHRAHKQELGDKTSVFCRAQCFQSSGRITSGRFLYAIFVRFKRAGAK